MKKRILSIAVMVAMLAVTILPVTVMGADIIVQGDASGSITITAPTLSSLGSLIGSGDATGTATPGSVTCTDSNGYYLTIVSNDADGKMVRVSGTEKLNNALLVTSALGTGTGATVTPDAEAPNGVTVTTSSTAMGATSAGSTGSNSITLSVSQAQQASAVSGTYQLTLTYTVTINTPS